MVKRTHREILISILQALNNGKEQAYGSLERKVNTNWKTIRDHTKLLALFEFIQISKENKIKISSRGREILKKAKLHE